MMSGVRGSFGGRPGALNIWVRPRPQKIWPMPAMLLLAGEADSSSAACADAGHPLFSHSSDTSPSVGPIWPPALDSESGRQALRIREGEVVTAPLEVIRV